MNVMSLTGNLVGTAKTTADWITTNRYSWPIIYLPRLNDHPILPIATYSRLFSIYSYYIFVRLPDRAVSRKHFENYVNSVLQPTMSHGIMHSVFNSGTSPASQLALRMKCNYCLYFGSFTRPPRCGIILMNDGSSIDHKIVNHGNYTAFEIPFK